MKAGIGLILEAGDKPRVVFEDDAQWANLGLSAQASIHFYDFTPSESVAYLRELASAAGDLANQIEKAAT